MDEGTAASFDAITAAVEGITAAQHAAEPVHPLFRTRYPVAVAIEGQLLIFEHNEKAQSYKFVTTTAAPIPLPANVAAAFSLEAYGGRIACVVGTEGLGSRGWYVKVLHEFVHCYQFETCEPELKRPLTINRADDPMWEIAYPFPYNQLSFVQSFKEYVGALSERNDNAPAYRQRVLAVLAHPDREYMIWQEWKEGYARLVENRLRRLWNLAENHAGAAPPFSRVSFYESGSLYIAYQNGGDLPRDLVALFESLKH